LQLAYNLDDKSEISVHSSLDVEVSKKPQWVDWLTLAMRFITSWRTQKYYAFNIFMPLSLNECDSRVLTPSELTQETTMSEASQTSFKVSKW